jgi:hypothetical protein
MQWTSRLRPAMLNVKLTLSQGVVNQTKGLWKRAVTYVRIAHVEVPVNVSLVAAHQRHWPILAAALISWLAPTSGMHNR